MRYLDLEIGQNIQLLNSSDLNKETASALASFLIIIKIMKLYKRDGRRFVEIQDVTGMFYQKDGTFQEKRDENSIGICVLQTYKIRKVALFERYLGNWNQCKEYCRDQKGYMPSIGDMLLLKPYAEYFTFFGWFWTSDEYIPGTTWGLNFDLNRYFSGCCNFYKSGNGYVLAFIDIELK